MIEPTLLLWLLAFQGSGDSCLVQRAELLPPGPPPGGSYATALDIDGPFAAVACSLGATGGVVHVFARREGSWEQAVVLEPPRPVAGEGFGNALALGRERLVVSASGTLRSDGVDSGSLYVYEIEEGSWVLRDQAFPRGSASWEDFGASIAAEGELLVVGAPAADDLGYRAGAAYVFRRDVRSPEGWRQEARLLPDATPTASLADFGHAVALEGETVWIGVPGRSRIDRFRLRGGAWRLVESLADPAPSRFGAALSVRGDSALVGAPFWPSPSIPHGAVHAYERRRPEGAWERTGTLRQSTSISLGFGSSVVLEDELAAVGSLGYLGVYPSHGTWLLERSGDRWGEPRAVVPLGSPSSFPLGNTVALEGRSLLVGAPGFTTAASAFAFDLGRPSGGSVVQRQGPGNPQALDARPASVGAELAFELGPFPPGYRTATLFGFEAPASIPIGTGTLLCQDAGSGLLFLASSVGATPGGTASWTLDTPPAAELAGFSFCAQAVFRSAVMPVVLTNALDIRLGSCECGGGGGVVRPAER